MATHIDRCIKCGRRDGQSTVFVRIVAEGGQTGVVWDGIYNQLCAGCRAKLTPMTEGWRRYLDSLSEQLWRGLMRRGCPCCEAGLAWHPAGQVHWRGANEPRLDVSVRTDRGHPMPAGRRN